MINLTKSVLFPCLESVSDYPHEWDTDFRSLKPGENRFLLQETLAPNVAIRCGTFYGPSIHRGEVPKGARTFYVLMSETDRHVFRGRSASRHDLMAFGANREVDTACGSRSIHCTISVSEDYLETLQNVRGPDVDINSGTIVNLEPAQLHDLERAINALTNIEKNPATYNSPEQLAHQENLAMTLLDSLECPSHSDPPIRNAYKVVDRALDYVERHLPGPVRVAVVCDAIGVSARTLELHFKKHLNTTPKRAIDQLRLAGLRKELISGVTGMSTVSQIAHDHGYTHLGQLSQDYFKTFGELPSYTLQQNLAPRKVD